MARSSSSSSSSSLLGRRSALALIVASVALVALLGSLCSFAEGAVGDAHLPDGFDHDPVIMTKEKLASLQAPAAAGTVKPAGVKAAVVDAVPLSPTVPSDGRFAPRHSFTGPFTPEQLVPYFEIGAGAVVDGPVVRLTPAKQSRTGFAWNTVQVEMSDWEVLLEFTVTGRALGGDGFALWFVERSEVLGTVYGSTDFFNGLAIIFDTFNNDAQGPSPLISAVFNDGTQRYDAGSDGASQALDSCSMDFRNQPTPTMAKLRYVGHVLSLEIALRRDTSGQPLWARCFQQDGIELGVDKYFGITAHTGDVADAHEILRFEVRDLSPAVVNLDEIREHYSTTIHDQQRQHEHGHSMTVEEFQHSTITYLAQIQGELNMLETSQSAFRDDMHEMMISQQHGDETTKATGAGSSLTHSGIANLAESQATMLHEIQELKAELQALKNQPRTSGGAAISSSGPVELSERGTGQLSSGLRDAIQTLVLPRSDALKLQVAELQHGLSAATVQLRELAASVKAQSHSGVNRDDSSSGSSSDLILLICAIFSAICIFALSCHTIVQHRAKDRYKLI